MALVPAVSALRTFPAIRTDTGPDGRRQNQPLATKLLGVQNAYALPEGPSRFSFHAATLWPLPQLIKGATESEEEPIKWIFPSIMAPIKSLISFKSNSHAKMAPDSGIGLMQGLACSGEAEPLRAMLAERGLLTRAMGSFLGLFPPLTVEERKIDAAVSIVDAVCALETR
jgi:hypothetical protein